MPPSRPEPKASTAKRRIFTPEELKKWTEIVDVAELKPHPQNPNAGDQERLDASIERHGQFESKLISSDGYMLSGNHFYHHAMEKGRQKMAVIRLPLQHDEPQAVEIMLAANHITRKGKDDEGLLAALVGHIAEVQGEVAGAGFVEKEAEQLIQRIDGSFEPPESAYKQQYGVIVMAESETQQQQIFEKLQAEGYSCKVVTT